MPRGGTLMTRSRLASSRGVVDQAQEGDHVLDFAAPVESLRADQPIGEPRLQEGFLEQAGHGIGAIHHRAFARLELAAGDQLRDRIHDEGGFGVIIGRFIEENLLAVRRARLKRLLAAAVRSAVDDAHGRIQDDLP